MPACGASETPGGMCASTTSVTRAIAVKGSRGIASIARASSHVAFFAFYCEYRALSRLRRAVKDFLWRGCHGGTILLDGVYKRSELRNLRACLGASGRSFAAYSP